MLLFAWLPALWFAVGFFVWEQSILFSQYREMLVPFLNGMPEADWLGQFMRSVNQSHPEEARHQVWAWLLQSFFRYPQGFLMVLVVGLIAPALISQDIRSRAFLLYFSRPLTRLQYMLGKSATIWTYLLLISTAPALCLYLLGILLSPKLEVVQATWDLPLRILAASAVLIIPTASLALCFSSLTQETRYATFAWFAIWVLGWFSYTLMASAEAFGQVQRNHVQHVPSGWSYLSLYHTLGRVQSWIFGFSPFSDAALSAAILVVITIVANLFLLRRISAPMRA